MSDESQTAFATFLAEVSEREGKATKGPWHAHAKPHPEAVRLKKEASGVSSVETLIYSMSRDYVCLPETFGQQRTDADFIAAARTDLPIMHRMLTTVRQTLAQHAEEQWVSSLLGRLEEILDSKG